MEEDVYEDQTSRAGRLRCLRHHSGKIVKTLWQYIWQRRGLQDNAGRFLKKILNEMYAVGITAGCCIIADLPDGTGAACIRYRLQVPEADDCFL